MQVPLGILDFSGDKCFFEDGNPMTTMTSTNTVVDGGKRLIQQLLYGSNTSGVAELYYYSIGSGVGATYAAMTKLQAEHTDGWTNMSATRTRSDKTNMFTISAPSGKYTGKWGEIGIYNRSGELFARSNFPLFTKAGDGNVTARYRMIL
jgi:hypothetical protein